MALHQNIKPKYQWKEIKQVIDSGKLEEYEGIWCQKGKYFINGKQTKQKNRIRIKFLFKI